MPSRHGLLVPFTFEQFLTAQHLRIFPITDLEPCATLSIRDVRAEFVLGHNTFQVQLADPIKKFRPVGVYVVRVSQPGLIGHPSQQPPQLLLAIREPLRQSLPSQTNTSNAKKLGSHGGTASPEIAACPSCPGT